MSERPNDPVLKTGVGQPTVGSNPTPSAQGCLRKSLNRATTSQFFHHTDHCHTLEVVLVTQLATVSTRSYGPNEPMGITTTPSERV